MKAPCGDKTSSPVLSNHSSIPDGKGGGIGLEPQIHVNVLVLYGLWRSGAQGRGSIQAFYVQGFVLMSSSGNRTMANKAFFRCGTKIQVVSVSATP